ncbi:MAG: phosphate propanoyltransferase [Erysipelotrichaceae bacterium]|nr:phosphate propanoyltransferase [Erysipelotrichaceae bacterium]MCR5095603.1 phosphate propanoyltransferase [Erysipelotrichaceae bacterium]
MEKFIVEVSARHIHVTKEQLAILYGEGHELTPKKALSQPGQFVCEEKLTLVGPRGELKVSILGPERKEGQVELSLTDARTLGVEAIIRESGFIEGTNGIKVVGPCGEVELEKGVIAAKRHIHMTPADAEKYGVENGQIVNVKVETEDRSLVFGDTVVRVRDDFALAMHIDTDEGNAAGIKGSAMGEIVK